MKHKDNCRKFFFQFQKFSVISNKNVPVSKYCRFFNTSSKLCLKMRRMSIVSLVLYFFGSSLRWTRRMDLILRALDTPDVVDYFSYPQHGQQVREKHFRGIWSQKLHSKLRRLRNFEMLMRTWKLTFCLETFFFESL